VPAAERRLSITCDLPEGYRSVEEESEMGFMRKQMLIQQRASFERTLQERRSFLSEKGIEPPKADKDTLVRKLRADIKAVNKRLRVIASNEKRTEEMAMIKAERAASPQKQQEGGNGEKPKKASEEIKKKKAGGEKKAAPQKASEGGKSVTTTATSEKGKAIAKKTDEETGEKPADLVKADK
jgi:hypothetical protein